MGYTHYWERPVRNYGSAYMFGKLALDAKRLVEHANANGIIIRDGFGVGSPEFTESHFSLNGDEETGNAYETFFWEAMPEQHEWRKGEPMIFNFCKTQYRPYDSVVTAILIRAKVIYGSCVEVRSDGSWSDWQAGRDMYEAVFGEVAPCPSEMVGV